MLQYLFDTDHLTLLQHRHPALLNRLATVAVSDVGVSAVTVEETLRGRLAALARARQGPIRIRQYALLIETVVLFGQITIVPFHSAAEAEFQQLVAQRLRVGNQDLKIAAVALANRLVLLTRNRRDFGRVPGLQLDDWSL